jgi:response regulator RpfG family c-di-GMP phosphodiesterase
MRQVVLIVESNNHAEKFFKSCLARNGYYAIATDDVDKALKLVQAWQPDLVMIDMHLADNATEWLIKSIKNAPDSSRIPSFFALVFQHVSGHPTIRL